MTTRNISLTIGSDAFLEKACVDENGGEAVRDVLRLQIKAGVDALDRGDFVEVGDAELDRFLEGLRTT